MKAQPPCVWLSWSLLALASGAAPPEGPQPPEVEVYQPLSREVSDYQDFTGRTEASATVQLKARVTGYLTRVLFNDGDKVKKGQLLLQIDPRPYQAELDKAEASVAVSQAVLARAKADLTRARALFLRKGVSKEELDKIAAEVEEAQARLLLAKANREAAMLNLDFTRVVAPMGGRIGRRLIDAGNLVKADETALATLISGKPMYVCFDVDERTALRLRRTMVQDKDKRFRVAIGLADEKGFPRLAEVDYVSNSVDPKAGTLRLRAALPNADGLLVPGLFVRIRLTMGKPHKALLVPERAVGRDLGRPFVLVANQKDEVEVRQVQLGQRHGDLVVVEKGLKAVDRVVLKGPQGLKEGMGVKPKKVVLPDGKE